MYYLTNSIVTWCCYSTPWLCLNIILVLTGHFFSCKDLWVKGMVTFVNQVKGKMGGGTVVRPKVKTDLLSVSINIELLNVKAAFESHLCVTNCTSFMYLCKPSINVCSFHLNIFSGVLSEQRKRIVNGCWNSSRNVIYIHSSWSFLWNFQNDAKILFH